MTSDKSVGVKDIRESISRLFRKKEDSDAVKNAKIMLQQFYSGSFANTGSLAKKYTAEEMAGRLDNLYDRIIDGSLRRHPKEFVTNVCDDIRYVGQCEGLLKATGDLSKEDMIKLNKLWKKYKMLDK